MARIVAGRALPNAAWMDCATLRAASSSSGWSASPLPSWYSRLPLDRRGSQAGRSAAGRRSRMSMAMATSRSKSPSIMVLVVL
ncbi:hypothetical protein G6F68_020615 [Rhizopus microsporus]|nr:hypothetical protein G6F68_020615 [Rhizopus microsporus]KAG1385509.1 hypothetical protein G6F59_017362 [Rhizopus arrhizus]